ncbi:acyl-CoA thioesterase [Chelatococcus asaccharovorans]|uniref:Acyl-CoA thioester hydrolase n=1 Tax=Chelatococcus asaccharovorans TaxID=28210 RepID=A0A2V3TYS9_9HYPH|nr:thioesterase family protein [Chelatococcus asaccharovorans]MBS7707775.1 thioesterase family protein [Chelatococcus asaccharovorans]PXW55072.1 acyl-CoA thioester hydrolase [Chelatococcus asaccharovorans]
MADISSHGDEYLLRTRPVTVRRRVRWGECDPAGVVYTARFSDYALSGFEYLISHLLGAPMHQALDGAGWGLPMKALNLTFHRSLWPGEWFDMQMRVGALRTRTFDLALEARHVESGEPCFSAALTPIVIEPATRRACAIPQALRERLEAYARQADAAPGEERNP